MAPVGASLAAPMFRLSLRSARRLACASLAAGLLPVAALPQDVLTVCRDDDQLRRVDPTSGVTLSSVTITVPGGPSVVGANGLAVDITTGTMWAILAISGAGRQLATIDPATGTATIIGQLTDGFAGLAYDFFTGTLYGVTGDGANVPETLHVLDRTTAAASPVMPLGNGTDGESIVVEPLTGEMYHASGYSGTRNVDRIFERVEVAQTRVVPIPYFGHDQDEIVAMAPWVGGTLLASDLSDDLLLIQVNGAVTRLSTLDHTAKGLAFPVPAQNTAHYGRYGSGCPDAAGFTPLLAGQTTPSSRASIRLWIVNARGGAPAALFVGTGANAAPITPACTVQILPVIPIAVPVTLAGNGASNGTASLALAIPTVAAPFDLYWQAATQSGGTLQLSNPLQVHVR